jgi:hypothetical protein
VVDGRRTQVHNVVLLSLMCACSSQEREAPIVRVKPESILIVVPSIVSSNPALPEIPRDPTWPSAPDVGYPIYRLADPALAYSMEEPNRGPWVTEEADNTPEGGSYTQHGHCEIMALTIHCSPEVGQLQVDPSGVHTPWRVARLDGVIQWIHLDWFGDDTPSVWLWMVDETGRLLRMSTLNIRSELPVVRTFNDDATLYRARERSGANALQGCDLARGAQSDGPGC